MPAEKPTTVKLDKETKQEVLTALRDIKKSIAEESAVPKTMSDRIAMSLAETPGKGVFSALRESLAQRGQEKKESFKKMLDPVNLIKSATGGSKLAGVLAAKALGRSEEEIRRVAGIEPIGKIEPLTEAPSVSGDGVSSEFLKSLNFIAVRVDAIANAMGATPKMTKEGRLYKSTPKGARFLSREEAAQEKGLLQTLLAIKKSQAESVTLEKTLVKYDKKQSDLSSKNAKLAEEVADAAREADMESRLLEKQQLHLQPQTPSLQKAEEESDDGFGIPTMLFGKSKIFRKLGPILRFVKHPAVIAGLVAAGILGTAMGLDAFMGDETETPGSIIPDAAANKIGGEILPKVGFPTSVPKDVKEYVASTEGLQMKGADQGKPGNKKTEIDAKRLIASEAPEMIMQYRGTQDEPSGLYSVKKTSEESRIPIERITEEDIKRSELSTDILKGKEPDFQKALKDQKLITDSGLASLALARKVYAQTYGTTPEIDPQRADRWPEILQMAIEKVSDILKNEPSAKKITETPIPVLPEVPAPLESKTEETGIGSITDSSSPTLIPKVVESPKKSSQELSVEEWTKDVKERQRAMGLKTIQPGEFEPIRRTDGAMIDQLSKDTARIRETPVSMKGAGGNVINNVVNNTQPQTVVMSGMPQPRATESTWLRRQQQSYPAS